MKLRREKVLWNVLLGTSVYLLDSLRSRLNEGIDDLSDRARDTYSEASRRAGDPRGRGGRDADIPRPHLTVHLTKAVHP